MGEELLRNNRAAVDITELQDSLSSEMDLNSSFKLSQGPIANKIIANANFAPVGYVLVSTSSLSSSIIHHHHH